jgi:hypothetical protein
MEKKCTKCGELKALTEFHLSKPSKDGRHTQCKICISENRKLFYKNNRQKIIDRTADYYLKNKEVRNEQSRSYYHTNKEACKDLLKEWHKRNPGVRNSYTAKRKAAKLKATPDWLTKEEREQIRCYYSLSAMRNRNDDKAWHVDHIVPLRGKQVCGLHVPWNLRVIPAIENIKKGNKFG